MAADGTTGSPGRGGRRLRLGISLDVAGFGSRAVRDQHEVQRRLHGLVDITLTRCGLTLDRLLGDYQWTGDGINVMLPLELDPAFTVPVLIRSLASELRADNARGGDRIRLRMAVGVGLVEPSLTGFNGPLIVDISRLVGSGPLRGALSDSPAADLAVALSDQAFTLVIKPGYPGIPVGQFTEVNVTVKEFAGPAWIWVSARQWSGPAYPPLKAADPEEIGVYQIRARLGDGTAGRVYLATRPGPGREALEEWTAVKVFDENLVADPDTRRRLVTGALAASVLRDDHLAAVTGSELCARQPWVASTLVRGPSLAATVTETGPLPAEAAGWLALGLARALATVHQARLTHHAIHPGNVLLDAAGPVLTDLGTSRNALTAGPGSAGDDVLALAATAFFAATGRSPWHEYPADLIPLASGTGRPDLTGCPPALTQAVSACLETDPRLRPTAADLHAWLAAVAGQRPRAWLPGPVGTRLSEYRRLPR